MEDKILEVLKSIDDKLTYIKQAVCVPCEKCEDSSEDKEDAEIMNFLESLANELGLKDKVVIRKVTINK